MKKNLIEKFEEIMVAVEKYSKKTYIRNPMVELSSFRAISILIEFGEFFKLNLCGRG